MRIDIIQEKKYKRLDNSKLKYIAKKTLSMEGAPRGAALTITLVSDGAIKKLNKKFKDENIATDVLAFSMTEGAAVKGQKGYLGDVVISVDTAARQAKAYNLSFEKEIYLYVIHGILHLLGYEDVAPTQRSSMQTRQEYILRFLCNDKVS